MRAPARSTSLRSGSRSRTARAGGLVIVAMTLLLCGFLIKGAVVPFHLWAADAYAVAPAPVCAVLGGVMTDIGLIGVARLYWTVFARAVRARARGGRRARSGSGS